jgi:transcriptional regulator with XRE-family HTH domain
MNDQTDNKLSFSREALAQGLKIAREACGKSTTECGELLGISASRIRSYESGRYIPSLPELESLSYLYNIPLPALLDPHALSKFIHEPETKQLNQLLDIRLRIIATRLELAREGQSISYKELAKLTNIPASRIKRYESGDLPIPLDELTVLSEALNVDFENLVDRESPIGVWQSTLVKMLSFSDLPEETQNFALDPANHAYIGLVKRLKEIGREKFEQLAGSIQVVLNTFDR